MYMFKDKVMVYDTDYQGIAHYASYYRFFTDAIEGYKRDVLNLQTNTINDNIWFVVVESKAQYHKSLHINDEIYVELYPKLSESKKALTYNLKIKLVNTGELCTEGYLTMVSINHKLWQATEIPEDLLKKIVKSAD